MIPNLNKVTQRVLISSVVLSGQEVSLKDAIYNATKGKEAAKNDAANPLVQDGMKLIPSVTRVFSLDKYLYAYLQAYLGGVPSAVAKKPVSGVPNNSAAGPLVALVSFYQEQKKVMEAPAVVATWRRVRGLELYLYDSKSAWADWIPGVMSAWSAYSTQMKSVPRSG